MEKIPKERIFYLKIECQEDMVEIIKILCEDLNLVLPEGNKIGVGLEYKSLQDLYNETLHSGTQTQSVKDLYAAIKQAMDAQRKEEELEMKMYASHRVNNSQRKFFEGDLIFEDEIKEVDPETYKKLTERLRNPQNQTFTEFLRNLSTKTNQKKKGA